MIFNLLVLTVFGVAFYKTLRLYTSENRLDPRLNVEGVGLMKSIEKGLFVCSQCDCVDHVELTKPDSHWLCGHCDPNKEWHGQFPREKYNPEKDITVNRPSGISFGVS